MNNIFLYTFLFILTGCAGIIAGIGISKTDNQMREIRKSYFHEQLSHNNHEEHGAHVHESIEAAAPIPSVRLAIHREPDSGYAVELMTSNFTFAPLDAGKDAVAGEGHAHLYLNGSKQARLYGSWYYLGILPPGEHTIAVRLSTNDHKELTHNSKKIEAVATLSGSALELCDVDSVVADHVVCYTDIGYSPKHLYIQEGQSVAFVRSPNAPSMWTASDDHPLHQNYNSTTVREHCPREADTVFDQCSNGNFFTFTFEENGTWSYHNHSLSAHTGHIYVQ